MMRKSGPARFELATYSFPLFRKKRPKTGSLSLNYRRLPLYPSCPPPALFERARAELSYGPNLHIKKKQR